MEARNCPKCKKVFSYKGVSSVCPECEKEEELIFDGVVKFVKEHPDSTLAIVSEKTKVSAKKILRYVREGRIEISKGIAGELRCEKCGDSINKGRYCESCVISVNNEINSMFETKEAARQTQNVVKMHIAEKKKKEKNNN